jgi:hypothetical protein
MAYRKSLDFLPSIFQTKTNEKILRATMDQLISEPEVQELNGYIGRKFNPALTPKDSYVKETFTDRQNYQLEPATIYTDNEGNIKFASSYVDLLNRIENLGGISSNPSRLFSADTYSYSGLFDFDKFINYSSYYWLPNGPDDVSVYASEIPVDQDITVNIPSIYSIVDGKYENETYDTQAFDVSKNDIERLSETGYTFSTTGTLTNPIIRVARGGTYRFNVNQSGHGFYIQAIPGNNTTYPWQKNLSIREVLGVNNNGEDVGTVTFNVPTIDAQDFFARMVYQDNINLVAYSYIKRRQLRYTEIQNANYVDFLNENVGIDGQRFINGKNILFLPSASESRVPQPWAAKTIYKEADLVVYGNTVYRAMADYTSGRFFTTGNLEIYDLEDHWYDPALFDDSTVGFGSDNFDRGIDVAEEDRLGWFTINITTEGIINLTPVASVLTNQRVKIGEGVEYGNREVYRTANNTLEVVPPITANLNFLYYQDALDPAINGVIEIIDQDNTLEINVNNIIGSKSYVSPNGVSFESGLKIKFIGNTVPAEYENNSYYVEGAGSSIELIPTSELETPESWLKTVSTPYDSDAYDTQSFDESQPAPIDKQYIAIKRNSKEGSAWTRHNRWFHEDVIKNTSVYNNYNTVLDQASRAKRPVIEFDANLQLFNFGRTYKTSVTVVDTTETDALSNVEGTPVETTGNSVSAYYSDGIPLVNGNRVIFANDISESVRSTIWRVDWITTESTINNRLSTFTGDGSTASFSLGFAVTSPIRLSVLVNGAIAQNVGFYWTLVGQNIVFTTAPADGADITVNYTFTQQLHLVPVDTVAEHDVILSTLGNTNQGTNWYYNGTNWVKSQSKTTNNQTPLFDLFNRDGISISDSSNYTGSNFVGNKIFTYKEGNNVKDTELGIRLAYRSIGNVGDILFVDHISNDTFEFESIGESTITNSTKGLEVAKNLADGSRAFVNQWVRLQNKSKQYQTETFFATQYQKNNFKLNITPSALGPDNIVVYKNNVALIQTDFDVETISGVGFLVLNTELEVGSKIDVKVFSSTFNNKSIWEIPTNLENNAKNQDIVEITLGQMRNHILESFINTPGFEGTYQGSNNVKDLANVKSNGGKILQNAGAPHLANLFLNDSKASFVDSVAYAQKEYDQFKNKFQRAAAELNLTNGLNPVKSVDEILNEIFYNKNGMFPYFRSDMAPAGSDYVKTTYTVDDTAIDTYYISKTFDITSASNRAVIVYLNNVQLTYGLDYTFVDSQPTIQLMIAPVLPEYNAYYLNVQVGDVIEIREYNNTDGYHIPQTPTKLGMYPSYRPKIIQSGYDGNTSSFIRGHDGSLTLAYNDYRDGIILELEKRIYNNIKSRYTGDLFDILGNIPGAFRTTDYDKKDIDYILSSNFSGWLGSTNLQVTDFTTIDPNNKFTWNYSKFIDIIDSSAMVAGGWRGLYKYFYDTDQPQLRPWEMLGFTEEPTWWTTEYGPAPYTSGNSVLWEDLEQGLIKSGIRTGIDKRFARPGLLKIIPVDDSGLLLSPFECLCVNTSTITSESWKFGDWGPVETAWRQSSNLPYAMQIAMALAKPAEYFGLFRDTIKQVKRVYGDADNTQWEFSGTGVRSKTEYVHGEVVSGNIIRSHGYPTWIAEYATSLNLDITNEVGKKLREVDLRLAYKVSGYTDKKYVKLYADQSSPSSVNSSILIPDNDYQIKLVKSAPRLSLTYSGVIVSRSGTGFVVRGYDQTKPYFIIETAKQDGENTIIQSGTDTVEVGKNSSGRFVNVPYGTEFFDKAQVVDFLTSIGRYQERLGFTFDRKIESTGDTYNWVLAAKEFLFWTQQGWENEVAITLSPISDEINYRSTRGTVDAISNRPYGSRILNNNFEIISPKNYSVNRNGRNFTLKTNDGSGIYLVDVDVVDYEHIIVLNNVTQFNDIVYQPELGNRQYRIKITGFRTGAWDGTFGAAGFIINDNNIKQWQQGKNYYKGEIVLYKGKYYVAMENASGVTEFNTKIWGETEYDQINSTLLPNLANKAGQLKSFYDFNKSNLDLDVDRLGKGLIGFTSREYLNNLGISDTSQVKFYQGLIRQKGSNNSLNKLLRAKLDNFDGSAEFYEQWAIRSGVYGVTANTRQVRLPLNSSTATSKNPIVAEFLDANDAATSGRVSYKPADLLTYARPYTKNLFSYRNSKSEVRDLPSAGFVKVNEVNYTSPTLARIGNFLDSNVTDGSRVWVGRNDADTWQVYRFTDINVRTVNATIDANGNAIIVTNTAHGLAASQRIYVKAYTQTGFSGYYQVNGVIDSNTFSLETQFTSNSINAPLDGIVYVLTALKQDSVLSLNDITPTNGWKTGDQFYLENASDAGWGVYEKTERYTTVNRYSDTDLSASDNLGVSVASSRSNNYVLAGSSSSQTVETYRRQANGTITEDVEISEPSTGLTDFGAVISASSAEYAAIGSPASGSNVGYVHILRRGTNGSFIVDQAIAPPALDANGGFGSAIALSDDANWLYIGQPNKQEGYICVYQLVQVEGSATTVTTTGSPTQIGDGSTAQITNNAIAVANVDAIGDVTRLNVGTTTMAYAAVSASENLATIIAGLKATIAYTGQSRFTIAAGSNGVSIDVTYTANGAQSEAITISATSTESPTAQFIGDGATVAFTLTNAAAVAGSSIDTLKIANNDGKIMIPYRDYTYNSSTKVITFVDAPALGEVNVFFKDYYSFVLTATLADSVGDKFGASLATTTDGSQIIIGTPLADTGSTTDSGKVYVVNRTVENQFADGTSTDYTTILSINGNPMVKVDDYVKILNNDYTFDGTTVSFAVAPATGSIVTIDTNNAVLSQVITEESSVDNSASGAATGAQFGYSLDLCPADCSLYVGSPYDDYTTIDGGQVYRFINQGRFYGVATGTVTTPTISTSTIISLNDFIVSFSGSETLTQIAQAINAETIPGVTALTENNVLSIVTDSTVVADKLKIVQVTGDFLADVGIDLYASQQVIRSPRSKNFNNFGKVVKISPDSQTLAVGTDVGDTILTTTFDSDTTRLDGRNTRIFGTKKQSGAVFVYQLISNPNATVNTPSQFVYAEQLTASDIQEYDRFGTSIDISNNTIYVGAPGHDSDGAADSGIIYGFANASGLKTWNLIRSETPKIDLDLINNAYIYDTLSGEKIIDLDIIDPAKGFVSGTAKQEITYQTTVDPAFYSNITNTSKGIIWGKDHDGEIWWDTSLTEWLEYEQGTIEDRAVNWGFSFPGSRIICAEWTESNTTPDQYTDINNPNSYPLSTTNYNVFNEFNEKTGRFVNKYYFWVAGKIRAPKNMPNRSISPTQIEDLISDPKINGVPYIAFLGQNSVGLYNVDGLLTNNSVLVIDYDVEKNDNVIHSEYELISEGDLNSLPSDKLFTKLIDSLSGQDTAGNLVPDVTLNDYEKHGVLFRPRQSIFKDRRQAVKEAVAYVNNFAKDIPAVYSKNIAALIKTEPYPDSTLYDEAVNNQVELTYLNINILPAGYLVLVKHDETTKNRWVIYKKDSNSAWAKIRIQTYNNNRYINRVDWVDPTVSVPVVVETVVNFEYNLQGLTATGGDFVKIQDNGLGLYKIVLRENNSWRTVKEENGTIELNASLWKTENNLQGWDRDGFGLQLFDDSPSIEIQKIFRAVYADIFVGEDAVHKNTWFMHMVKYALSETKYNDWVFKTSLIKINQIQRALQQIPLYQRDNQDLIRQYVEEVKPYSTKISEFVLQYSSNENATLNTTDFDLPAYYNFATSSYRSPTGLTVEDDIILQLDPYLDWTNNHTLELNDIAVYYGGSGYLTAPEIVISGGGGSGATAAAVVASGRIIDVIVTNKGSGYVTTPTATINQYNSDPALLSAQMINNKVRSFDTTIKFDRVSTTAGWLVQFKDSSGNPVDVRNELINRVDGDHGVIDEVLHLFSLNNWIVASSALIAYPVSNVPNFRVFNDTSGRVQFFDRRDTRGWTPELLESFISALGTSVGVNNIDVSRTTVTVDGSLANFAPSVLPWTSGLTYYVDEIIVNEYKLYRVTESFTASSTRFDSTYLVDYSGAALESHIDRTWAFYQPKDGMLGRDLSQLFDNVVFPGVNLLGANFSQSPGFDVGAFDSSAYDISIIGPEGVAVIDPNILDQTLYSTFLDTALGTRPEDLISNGGSFVDEYHSHAPEEMVPGRVYDSLDIKVHTLAASASTVNDGFGLDWTTSNYITDGTTTRFSFAGEHIGDYFLVYLKNGGPRYRDVTDYGQSLPASIPAGSYYEISNNQGYTVDWETSELVFNSALDANDILQIFNLRQTGESIVADETFTADGTDTLYQIVAPYADVARVLVLVDGVQVYNYTFSADISDSSITNIEFAIAPTIDSHIHIVASNNFEKNTLSKPYTQLEIIDSSDRVVDLSEDIRYGRSKDTVLIVELNGLRLKPGNTNYYTGNGSTTEFLLPSSAAEVYTTLTFAGVQVWVDGTRLDSTSYALGEPDGVSIPLVTFFNAPVIGADISVTYTGQAEYFYSTGDNTVRIADHIAIADGSLIAITSFSSHDVYKIKTKVFVGTDQFVSSQVIQLGYDEGGFDSSAFDSTDSITVIDITYPTEATQNDALKVFVYVDGTRQTPNNDYTISDGFVTFADSINITNSTEIVITWTSSNLYKLTSTFQIFKGMDETVEYNRVAVSESTALAANLYLTDTEITVVDGSNLAEPNPDMSIPGVVFINSERIVYYTKSGNTLGQLRRGTQGTGAKTMHAVGSIVTDASLRTRIPNGADRTWYNTGASTPADGSGLQSANTIQARFLTEKKGLVSSNTVL